MPLKKKKIPVRVTAGNADVRARLEVMDLIAPHAVLATVGKDGPHTSLVAYSLTPNADGVLFSTPRSTRKYKNILKNPNVSLLIDNRTNSERDYFDTESISVSGRAKPLRKGKKRDELADFFAGKHPGLRDFLSEPATVLVLVAIESALHITQFQQASFWRAKD